MKDWPGIVWSHRRSDDALATRVTIDIDAATDDTITTTLAIGHQSPNLTQVRQTFRHTGVGFEKSGLGMWSHQAGFTGTPSWVCACSKVLLGARKALECLFELEIGAFEPLMRH